jgi:serine/threonine protein kinase
MTTQRHRLRRRRQVQSSSIVFSLIITAGVHVLPVHGFVPSPMLVTKDGCLLSIRHHQRPFVTTRTFSINSNKSGDDNDNGGGEEWSDFDDYVGDVSSSGSSFKKDDVVYNNIDANVDDSDQPDDANKNTDTDTDTDTDTSLSDFLFTQRTSKDLTGVQTRLFSLGQDFIVTDFVGNMGFEEVVDWQYYYENEDDPEDRKVVQPNPFDESKPKRTRTSSGSVVRIFRGEWMGRLGGTLRSKGLDRRVLIKEYTGKLALELARREQVAIGKLQSKLVADDDDAVGGDWIQAAASRTVLMRKDDANVADLLQRLSKAPFLGILGEVNLAELEEDMDPNDFYRALGVPPPKTEAVWIVYEYAGLNTVASYASSPPQVRRAQQPPKKNFFGGIVEPPPLPSFEERANYIVKGVMKGAIEALANIHEAGMAHRSIGRSSLVMSTPSQDKREASSIYATRTASLQIKVSDFGFSGLLEDSCKDEEFLMRARAFGLSFRKGDTSSLAATNFAMAEDLHALGFVFLGLLLVTLAELPTATTPMPATDEDTLQKLLTEIFGNDFSAFREYVEAEDVWTKLVELLDEKDGAGWTVLETLFTAREKTAENKNSLNVITARGLLNNPFFQN